MRILNKLIVGVLASAAAWGACPDGAGVQYTITTAGLACLSIDGVDLTWNGGYVAYSAWSDTETGAEGPLNETGSSGSATAGDTGDGGRYYQINYDDVNSDADRDWTMRVEYRGEGTDTLQIDLVATSRATTDWVRPLPALLTMTYPDGDISASASINSFLPAGPPYGYSNNANHTAVYWMTPLIHGAGILLTTSIGTRTKLSFNATRTIDQTEYRDHVEPGEVGQWTLYLRFGASDADMDTLGAAAYTEWQDEFGVARTNWVDRGIIARIFVADATRTAANPRGYRAWNDDPAVWRTGLLSWIERDRIVGSGGLQAPGRGRVGY